MLNIKKLQSILEQYPSFRSRQANRAVFRELVGSWEEVTNLPKDLRAILERECPLAIEAEVVTADDGKTAKAVISLDDRVIIETVLMRHRGGGIRSAYLPRPGVRSAAISA